jgi:hypothetical protein
LPFPADEAVNEGQRQEDQDLAAREREQPPGQRHRHRRVAERVDESEGRHERPAVIRDLLEQSTEARLELAVLDVHGHIAR